MHGKYLLSVRWGIGLVFSLGLVVAGPAHAENNTDYIFNGPTQTTNYGGALYIPMSSPGTNNSLQILNGGAVTNAGGALGLNSGDRFNFAIVDGLGSIWHNSGDYSIGSAGSNNRLLLTNQGVANLVNAYVGSTGSTNNQVIVTGVGSTWNVSSVLYAGYAGVGSIVTIADGGTINAAGFYFGLFAGSSNTTLAVTGSGSTLNSSGLLWMGAGTDTGGNTLTISESGKVVNTQAIIRLGAGGGNNRITVSGPGSIWTNTTELRVGQSGAGNQIVITNGGRVYSAGSGSIGFTSSDNSALVIGPDSLLHVNGNFSVGNGGNNNLLTISDGGLALRAPKRPGQQPAHPNRPRCRLVPADQAGKGLFRDRFGLRGVGRRNQQQHGEQVFHGLGIFSFAAAFTSFTSQSSVRNGISGRPA
jgi:fibronectin-binding autotransporter adhesin